MPDISMCKGTNCNLKEECYRYKATPSDWQSYFTEPPLKEDGTCVYLLGFENQMVSKNFKKARTSTK
jgi:hypothetical protein